MTNNSQIPFRRGVVEPVACIKAGWALVKAQYWPFVGMCFVGMLIGTAVPFGILLGPMMCGVYLSLFQKRRGQTVEFGTLFKGFDYFGASVIATLLHVLPIMAVVVPAYLFFYVGMVLTMVTQGNEPNSAAMFAVFGVFILFWLAVIVVVIFVSIGFTFAYPLIVDRGLPGFEAVKLSFRAAMGNFWRLLGLSILNFLIAIPGVLLCYVGVFLVFPISFAGIAMAYEQVFGLRDPSEVKSNLPPPPPSFN